MMTQRSPMVKDLPESERPREKLLRKGAKALSNVELLAILLRTGTKEDSVIRVAEKLLALHKNAGLSGIHAFSPKDFAVVKGIGDVKAITVIAALELGMRLAEEPSGQRVIIQSPKDVVKYMMPHLRYENKEHFIAMLLNTKNCVLATPTISIGSLNASIVHPREVFAEAIKYSAASMILVHNHPSGDPTPSTEDILVTKKLMQAGEIMDIFVLDHIIIGDYKYISIKEKGLIY